MLQTSLPKEAPFAIEPIVAYRAWTVDKTRPHRGPFLRSLTYRVPWPERRPMRAHCLAQFGASLRERIAPPMLARHRCPDANHRCGIYALRYQEDIVKWATSPNHVAGIVRLWGRVYLYEKGFIAEYAYPLRLIYRNSAELIPDEVLEELSDSYGVEIDWDVMP